MNESAIAMDRFEKDPKHWLKKLTPNEWIRAAMKELRAAEESFEKHDGRGGLAGCRRAAGMALNGALLVEPNEAWKRTYIEHLQAVALDANVPSAVNVACKTLIDAQPPGAPLVSLRMPGYDGKLVEATRDVMAHAYAIVARYEAIDSHDGNEGERNG